MKPPHAIPYPTKPQQQQKIINRDKNHIYNKEVYSTEIKNSRKTYLVED